MKVWWKAVLQSALGRASPGCAPVFLSYVTGLRRVLESAPKDGRHTTCG